MLVERAKEVFLQNQCNIVSQVGLIFCIDHKRNKQMLCVIPINANDEYFETLQENLKNNDFHRI